jgi:hypothetical protein
LLDVIKLVLLEPGEGYNSVLRLFVDPGASLMPPAPVTSVGVAAL